MCCSPQKPNQNFQVKLHSFNQYVQSTRSTIFTSVFIAIKFLIYMYIYIIVMNWGRLWSGCRIYWCNCKCNSLAGIQFSKHNCGTFFVYYSFQITDCFFTDIRHYYGFFWHIFNKLNFLSAPKNSDHHLLCRERSLLLLLLKQWQVVTNGSHGFLFYWWLLVVYPELISQILVLSSLESPRAHISKNSISIIYILDFYWETFVVLGLPEAIYTDVCFWMVHEVPWFITVIIAFRTFESLATV